jgi:SAM-dependent methyltransferase
MYAGDGAHYFSVGLSAIHCIDYALSCAKVGHVESVLDFPCGYGRVLRFLSAHFPVAKVTACELSKDAVQFCVNRFGAWPAYSSIDLSSISFKVKYDLIWCGSLITHLDQAGIDSLLELFGRSLAPGGLVVMTTHGERVAEKMERGEFDYGIAADQIPRVISSYRDTGYGFTDYPDMTAYGADRHATGYGVSLTSPDWIRERVAEKLTLKEVSFQPNGWDNHQDVFGFVRLNQL